MKHCNKCGQDKELTEFHKGKSQCKECILARNRLYYGKNKERMRSSGKRSRLKHAEKRREDSRLYYAENREACDERNRQWVKNNPEGAALISRRYYQANKEQSLVYGREWRKNNPEKAAEQDLRYRERHPEKVAARNAVNSAVRTGRLPHISTQICADSGEQAEEYHHHLGYAPEHHLDVTPLTRKSHDARHDQLVDSQ